MATNLTPEQIARIEKNRKIALDKRAARLQQTGSLNKPNQSPSGTPSTSYQEVQRNLSKPNTSTKLFPSYPLFNVNIVKSDKSDDATNSNKPEKSSSVLNQSGSGLVKSQTAVVGTCKLISKDRFTVDMPYQQQAVDLFRTIKGKEYDSKSRLWTFPVTEYFNLKRAISVLKPLVVVGDLPKCIIETFITKARVYQQDMSKIDISRIDEKLRNTLYPFQIEGVQYGVSKNGRCLIADDMGLGKSIQALGIADYYRADWPLLIVCPSSMRFQWEEEVRVNLPNSVHTHQVFVMTTGKDIVDGARVLIISYDLLTKKKDLVKEMGFGVVIMDESHIIKSYKTQRGKSALEVSKHCKRVILLSGTPILSRPIELYTQLQAIDSKTIPYFIDYGVRYCNGTQTTFGWDFSGSSNMEELRLLLETRFMIRRLKCDVLTQLPSKIRQVVVLKSATLNKSSASMDAFALRLQSSSLKGSERHGCLLQYFAETAKNKSTAVCEYITDLLQDDRKFLCFAHHTEMLDAICNTLENKKTYYIRIDGSVCAEDRKGLCDKFQYEDKWKVAVLSLKAANTGLTLTAAQVVVFAELYWNPGDLVQAEDRVHRIGQEDCVVVKYLIAKGTADDYLWPLIHSKLEVLNKAGLSKDSYITEDAKRIIEPERNNETQTKINDYFEHAFSDDDNEDLLKVMDEIEDEDQDLLKAMEEFERSPVKKIKLDY